MARYVRHFNFEIKNNAKAQKALDELAQYEGIITLLCHCEDENICHRSLVKQMIIDRQEKFSKAKKQQQLSN